MNITPLLGPRAEDVHVLVRPPWGHQITVQIARLTHRASADDLRES
jgi:hypothetical protein